MVKENGAANGQSPLLDLTELLPASGQIKAGDQYFTVNTDISPTLAGRVTRWFVRYQEAIQGTGDINEGELWTIVGVLLNVTPEQAQTLGFPACLKLVAFLLKPLRDLGKTIAL